jgi:hypothetical protein
VGSLDCQLQRMPLPKCTGLRPGCLPRCCRGRPPLRAHAAPTYYNQPTAPPGAYAAGGRAYGSAPGGGSLLDLPRFSFMDTGARVKVMRHLQARDCRQQAAKSSSPPEATLISGICGWQWLIVIPSAAQPAACCLHTSLCL